MTTYVEEEFGKGVKIEGVPATSKIAGHFNVSLRAVAVRLEQVGLAVDGLYGRVNAEVEYGGFGRSKKPNTRAVRRLRSYGSTMPRRLFTAEDEGMLTETHLCEYLRLSRAELSELRSEYRELTSGA